MKRQIAATAQAIQSCLDEPPRIGLILGTGLGILAEEIQEPICIPYEELPHFPRSTAPGHEGQFVCGQLAGAPVIAMQGRFHLYEGYRLAEITLPIRVMRLLGVERLVVSNASGGLNPNLAPGEIMLINRHINFMWGNGRPWSDMQSSARTDRWANPYDRGLIDRTLAITKRGGFPAHEGVYVGVPGPNYETRAEYRFFRKIGGDVVGMSTIPEAIVARRLGMRVLGLSTVTNMATTDSPTTTNADEVISIARQASSKLRHIVTELIQQESAPSPRIADSVSSP